MENKCYTISFRIFEKNCQWDIDDEEDTSELREEEKLVDKNNPLYYGVPDYTYQEGPITIKELDQFVDKWKEEIENRGTNEIYQT